MKESFYIRHDYNSRNDEKILRLRQKYPNGAGYAIFWMLIEKLAESSEGRIKLEDADVLAFEIQMESKWITDVILSYNLFETDKVFFWSNRLLSDLAERNEKSKRAVLANKIRWKKAAQEASKNPNGVQMDSEMESKERKGKERKERISTTNVVEASPQERKYGNEEINKMLEALKGKIRIADFADAQKWARIYAKHCVALLDRLGKDEFVRRLNLILADDFKRKNCNNIKFLYGQLKGFIEPNNDVSNLIFN